MKLSIRELKQIIKEEKQKALLENEERESEMKQFSRSKSGKKVASTGDKVITAARTVSEVAEDQTGSMRNALYSISNFVEKIGLSLSYLGNVDDDVSATASLPTAKELKHLHKIIQRLEK